MSPFGTGYRSVLIDIIIVAILFRNINGENSNSIDIWTCSNSTEYECNMICSNEISTCQNNTILCPINSKCNVYCSESEFECNNLTINGSDSSELYIDCSSSSCNGINIYCPINTNSTCIIDLINDTNSNINIYSQNGWNDLYLDISDLDLNNSNIIMYCTLYYNITCIITDFDECTDDYITQLCNGIIYKNNLTTTSSSSSALLTTRITNKQTNVDSNNGFKCSDDIGCWFGFPILYFVIILLVIAFGCLIIILLVYMRFQHNYAKKLLHVSNIGIASIAIANNNYNNDNINYNINFNDVSTEIKRTNTVPLRQPVRGTKFKKAKSEPQQYDNNDINIIYNDNNNNKKRNNRAKSMYNYNNKYKSDKKSDDIALDNYRKKRSKSLTYRKRYKPNQRSKSMQISDTDANNNNNNDLHNDIRRGHISAFGSGASIQLSTNVLNKSLNNRKQIDSNSQINTTNTTNTSNSNSDCIEVIDNDITKSKTSASSNNTPWMYFKQSNPNTRSNSSNNNQLTYQQHVQMHEMNKNQSIPSVNNNQMQMQFSQSVPNNINNYSIKAINILTPKQLHPIHSQLQDAPSICSVDTYGHDNEEKYNKNNNNNLAVHYPNNSSGVQTIWTEDNNNIDNKSTITLDNEPSTAVNSVLGNMFGINQLNDDKLSDTSESSSISEYD